MTPRLRHYSNAPSFAWARLSMCAVEIPTQVAWGRDGQEVGGREGGATRTLSSAGRVHGWTAGCRLSQAPCGGLPGAWAKVGMGAGPNLCILLLDMDGVLIEPGGYHGAFRQTVNHFSQRMGLGDCAPDERAIQGFEVCGIGLEWDSSAICLGVLLTELWKADVGLHLPGDLEALLALVRKRHLRAPGLDYASWAVRVAQATPPGGHPPDTARRLLLKDASPHGGTGRSDQLWAALGLFLGSTRDLARSPTMRLIQNYTLGSRLFEETYGRRAETQTPSLLQAHDRPTLGAAERERLLALVQEGKVRAAVYTLRLSRPGALGARRPEYAPEAEIAIEAAGLTRLPLVGYGQMSWLAAQHDEPADRYVKPSPVHSLAAVARAVGGEERESLESAYQAYSQGRLAGPLRALEGAHVDLNVFEDSALSIQGVQEAVRLLRRSGVEADCQGWGIGSSPERAAALHAIGVRVFPALGQALGAALGSWRSESSP